MNPMFGIIYVFREILACVAVSAIVVLFVIFGTAIYRRFTGLTRNKAVILLLVATAMGVGLSFLTRSEPLIPNSDPVYVYSHDTYSQRVILKMILSFILACTAVPFAVRLYRKWIGAQLTELEKTPGIEGLRAWLDAGNVICAILVSIGVWKCFDYPLLPTVLMTFGVLLAYPVLNLVCQSAQPAPVPAMCEGLASEREKVLQLLEAGRITAIESADLLNALGHTVQPPPKRTTSEINPQRKIVLIGSALLLIGFFLPWFSYNPVTMANELMSELQQKMGQVMPQNAAPTLNFSSTGSTIYITGCDVGHGLGWLVLLLGVAAVVIPNVTDKLDFKARKKVALFCFGAGMGVLMYLLSNSFRFINVGIILCLVGLALGYVGTLKEPQVD